MNIEYHFYILVKNDNKILYIFYRMSLNTHLLYLREMPETMNAGLKWTEEEDKQLMEEVSDGYNIDVIANNHKRTTVGIKTRIMRNAINMLKENNMTIEEVSELVNIPINELYNYKKKLENKETKNKETKNNKSVKTYEPKQDLMSVLVEIRDYLKIIAEK